MNISYAGVMRAIGNLTAPMREKVLKKLGLSTKGLPGRTSKKAGITVGKDRLKIEKKIDKYKGAAVGAGTTVAAYTASDFINDILGIKGAGKGSTFTPQEKLKMKKAQAKNNLQGKSESISTVKKKTPPKIADKDLPKRRPKKKNGVTFEFETIPKGKAGTKRNKGGIIKTKKRRK